MMVIKLYISGISGNKEVKKKQQRVQMILDSKQINYEAIDITEPGKEKDKEFMQQNGKVRESLGKYPLPPQIFNDDDFCGDYEDFDMANEVDELEKFLHIETSSKDSESDAKQDESNSFCEKLKNMKQPSSDSEFNPYEYHTFKIKFNGVNGLKEPIINTHDLAGENEQTEEVKKSEVNGESEASPSLETSENITKNIQISSEEVVAPEKEEYSAQEIKANDERSEEEKEDEDDAEDKQEQEDEEEAEEEEEKGDVENPKEETIESSNKENSPSLEEEKDNNNEEEIENEKEEDESDNESPQSEKSQE